MLRRLGRESEEAKVKVREEAKEAKEASEEARRGEIIDARKQCNTARRMKRCSICGSVSSNKIDYEYPINTGLMGS
jgi:hypothetical protein